MLSEPTKFISGKLYVIKLLNIKKKYFIFLINLKKNNFDLNQTFLNVSFVF